MHRDPSLQNGHHERQRKGEGVNTDRLFSANRWTLGGIMASISDFLEKLSGIYMVISILGFSTGTV